MTVTGWKGPWAPLTTTFLVHFSYDSWNITGIFLFFKYLCTPVVRLGLCRTPTRPCKLPEWWQLHYHHHQHPWGWVPAVCVPYEHGSEFLAQPHVTHHTSHVFLPPDNKRVSKEEKRNTRSTDRRGGKRVHDAYQQCTKQCTGTRGQLARRSQNVFEKKRANDIAFTNENCARFLGQHLSG